MKKPGIKYNNILKLIVVRRLPEQHVIQKQGQAEKIAKKIASHGGWREMSPNLTF